MNTLNPIEYEQTPEPRTRRAAFGHAALALAFAAILPGCSETTLSVRHDPPYRAEPHVSTISVTARAESGIQRIVVDVLVGDLVACTDPNLPSMFPCRRNGFWQTYTCNFALAPISGDPSLPEDVTVGPMEATCPVSRTLNSLSLLTYRATAFDSSGRATSTNYITYSGGAPPVAFPITGPSFADVLRPVWLESQETPVGGDPAQIYWDMTRRVDIAFLPEVDWQADYRGFADMTGDIASHLLFEPDNGNAVPPVMEDYFLWKQQFSYWVGPTGADVNADENGDPCTLSSTGWVGAALAVTDGQAIVHKQFFRDCTPGLGWGTVSAEPNAYVTYAHESGHFLFAMGDEYQGAERVAESDPPNTFVSPQACEQTATAYNFATELCVRIPGSNLWRITDGSPEIMAVTLPFSHYDWQDTNKVVFERQIAACLRGACR